MKRKIFNNLIVIISLFVLLELIARKNIVYSSVIYALDIWVNNIIPSLFPFFIITDILINYNITDYIPKNIKKVCKHIFNINDNMFTILILSMISGFPSNARNTRTMYDNGLISIEEANHILIFTHFANPVFILTTVAVFFLHNEKIGYILIITHYISNFILGICFRKEIKYNHDVVKRCHVNVFSDVFVKSIKHSIDTILTICGVIVVFLLLSSIIISTFNVNGYALMAIRGFFEITIGIEELSRLPLSNNHKAVIASMILAFGGISVHVQVLSQLVDTKIKYIYFFIGRMYQMIIAGTLTYIICLIYRI